jgi:hypothetical protein
MIRYGDTIIQLLLRFNNITRRYPDIELQGSFELRHGNWTIYFGDKIKIPYALYYILERKALPRDIVRYDLPSNDRSASA